MPQYIDLSDIAIWEKTDKNGKLYYSSNNFQWGDITANVRIFHNEDTSGSKPIFKVKVQQVVPDPAPQYAQGYTQPPVDDDIPF